MPPSNHMQNEEASYGGADFQPFDFDETVEPDLADGDYMLEISDVKARKSNPDKVTGVQYPQVVLEWKATEAYDDDEACQRSVGNTVSEFLTFRPKGDRKGNMSKQRLTMLRNRFGIDSAVVPTRPTSLSDYNDLCAALKGQASRGRAVNKMDNTGTLRTNLVFLASADADSDAEEEPVTAPVPSKGKAAAGKPAVKSKKK